MIPTKEQVFNKGIHNVVNPDLIPEGAASDSLGWLTGGDQIELSRGKLLLGTDESAGRVRGIHVATRIDKTEVWFRKNSTKIQWFDPATSSVWTDIVTGLDATHEYIFTNYTSLAGIFVYVGGLGGLFKIHVANPSSYADQYDVLKNYKAFVRIDKARARAWGMANDKTGLYLSYIDEETYTTVSSEAVDTGDGGTTYGGTLAFKAGGAKRTCFAIEITDGTETFTDNRNGILTGSLGGTGTINYTTGAWTATFNSAVGIGTPITGDYQWEDATNGGVMDFTYSPTRVAGEGDVFRQDEGGDEILDSLIDGGSYYSIKRNVTYELTLTPDDTNATNRVIRRNIGIPSMRAAVETSLGIVMMDTSNIPRLMRLEKALTTDDLVPNDLAPQFDFDIYDWSDCWMETWGNFIVFGGKTKDADDNNRLFIWDSRWKSIDVVPFFSACGSKTKSGTLIIGDSISDNVFEAFTGVDDDGFPIQPNYWISRNDLLGYEGLKKSKKMYFEGLIGTEQTIKVYGQYDDDAWELIATISGGGAYVALGDTHTIGSSMIGEEMIGGEGSGISAFPFHYPIKLRPPKFYRLKLKFEATGLGWASISMIKHEDVRVKSQKVPRKYRQYRADPV